MGDDRAVVERAPAQLVLEVFHLGGLGEADRLYAAILQSDPTNFYALYRRAILCAGRGDDIEALRLIQAAMKRSVTVEVLGDCGVILDRLGRSAEAMETYDRALIVDPHNVLALLHRGRLFTGRRDGHRG